MSLKHVVGIDHVVVMVEDLDAAANNWKRLGFTISPRGTHSAKLGSGNYTIMFGDDYIELLGILTPTEYNAGSRAFIAERGGGVQLAHLRVEAAWRAAILRSSSGATLRPRACRRATAVTARASTTCARCARCSSCRLPSAAGR